MAPPDGRSILKLITTNNLKAIRSLLNPLTLHNRLLLVYEKVDKKSLLYYACELGFKDLVKYFLDECGSDIEDGYCDSSTNVSPMRVAIRTLDFPLISLLRRRGASIKDKRTISCVYYAFKNHYYSLMSIFRLHNRPKVQYSVPSIGNQYSYLFITYNNSDFTYNARNMNFLSAASKGDLAELKRLINVGIDKNFQNYGEEDALCVAILNNQVKAVNFLINIKLFTLKSYASALELCGAKFIVFRSDVENGLRCWRKSVRIRLENNIGFLDKHQIRTQCNLGPEFRSLAEIERLENGDERDLYKQVLNVFVRLLSKSSPVTQKAFLNVTEHLFSQENLFEPLQLLSELYYFPTNNPHSPVRSALQTMRKLFHHNFTLYPKSKTEYLERFDKLFNFLEAGIWIDLLINRFEFHQKAYICLLDQVLINIDYMTIFPLDNNQQGRIETGIQSLLERPCTPYPTTLVHRAIQNKYPLSVVSLLLKCSDDPNCTDISKTTPLHLVSHLPKHDPYLYYMTELLLDAGAHIDSVNAFGVRPLEALKRKKVIENHLNHTSLQCLAANAIFKFGIDLPDKFPKILEHFTHLHSSYLF